MSRAKADVLRLHAFLMERFPAAFPKDYDAIQPLKIGILADLLTRLGDTVDRKLLNCAVANQTSRDGYLLAVLHGDVRIDLNGNPAGTISEDAKARARQRLAASVQRQQARSAARKAQAEKERRRAEERRRIEEKRRLKAERRRLHEEAIRRKAERLAAAEAAGQPVLPSARALRRHRSAAARPARPAPPVQAASVQEPPAPVPSAPSTPAPVTVKTGAGTATVTVTVKKRRTLSLKPEE
ncbi:MAG TPA: ProQ/FinO family protein [Candidatus Competibacteraceae bacterium]|jgi:sRNA-binding protein|nr:ProQ/FinO family protein [Candidatus Competibacteraceae bacterium]